MNETARTTECPAGDIPWTKGLASMFYLVSPTESAYQTVDEVPQFYRKVRNIFDKYNTVVKIKHSNSIYLAYNFFKIVKTREQAIN